MPRISQPTLILLSIVAVRSRGIELGGTEIPREKFLVFICVGSSNMSGRGTMLQQPVHPRLWKYNVPCEDVDTAVVGSLNEWVPAQAPTCGSRGGGPGMPLLNEMLEHYPDYYFGVILHARSGRWRYNCRDKFQKGQEGYEITISAALREMPRATFRAIIAMLGDTEVQTDTYVSSWEHINHFAEDVASMVDSMRGDLGLPTLPYLHTEIPRGEGIWDPGRAECVALRTQIDLIPDLVSHSAIIPSDSITLRDDHHYNLNGHLMWAERVGELLVSNGWEPGAEDVSVHARPPHRPSAPARRWRTGVNIPGKRSRHGTVADIPGFRIDGTRRRPAGEGRTGASVVVIPHRAGRRHGARSRGK